MDENIKIPFEMLAPCPFCGASAVIEVLNKSEHDIRIICENRNCVIRPHTRSFKFDFAEGYTHPFTKMWNTRKSIGELKK